MIEAPEDLAVEERLSHLAEYGLAGDHAGARRTRRGFRFLVTACVFFTFALWFSENYLRFDRTESQYRMALTLPPDSARAVLRNVVKRDRERNETPASRYLEALAAVEEADLILPRYEEAYRLNPGNPSLVINYGCRLYLNGQFRDARERFREAGIQPPRNALPRYLEAAALAAGAVEGDITETVALIARTNSTGDPVIFPQPLWHQSLPRRGAWYARLRHEIADLCCAPIYRLRSQVFARARQQIEAGQHYDWDSWLETLQVMGQRLMGSAKSDPANLGVSQMMAGIQIQIDAIALRQRVAEMGRGAPDAALIERAVKLGNALNELKTFEELRSRKTAGHRAVVAMPMRLLGQSFGLVLLVYLLVTLLSRFTEAGKRFWAVPHPHWALYPIAGVQLLFLALLLLIAIIQRTGTNAPALLLAIGFAWNATMLAAIAFVLLYPAFSLPGARCVSNNVCPDDPQGILSTVRWHRLMAYISLIRRTCGILLGGLTCVACFWLIGYRLAAGIYPTQMELIVTGLESEELALIIRLLEMLV